MSLYFGNYLQDFVYWSPAKASSSFIHSFSLLSLPTLLLSVVQTPADDHRENTGCLQICWVNSEAQANTLFTQKYFRLFSGAKRILISDRAYLLKESTQVSAVTFHFNGYWSKSGLGIAFPYLCKNLFMPLRSCAKRNQDLGACRGTVSTTQ